MNRYTITFIDDSCITLKSMQPWLIFFNGKSYFALDDGKNIVKYPINSVKDITKL